MELVFGIIISFFILLRIIVIYKMISLIQLAKELDMEEFTIAPLGINFPTFYLALGLATSLYGSFLGAIKYSSFCLFIISYFLMILVLFESYLIKKTHTNEKK